LNALLPIVYYLYKTDKVKNFCTKISYKKDRAIIKQWLHVVLLHRIFGGQAEGVLKAIRDTIRKEIANGIVMFPASQIAKRLSKTNKSITVDDEFIEELLYTSKDSRYAFPILALLFPHLDYKNRDFHLDHCHPISQFKKKNLKAKGIILNDDNKEYFEDPDYYNSIINLQMLDRNDNMSKSAKDLDLWVSKNSTSLKKHFLPKELELKDFPVFVEKREKLLKKALIDVLTL
jgi:hypothetical protein